jgi:hypothetical protein
MKRTSEHLLDEMLEDSATPEFRAALLDKTLQSARRRKRLRRFNLTLGACTLAGIATLMGLEIRVPTTLPNQIPHTDSSVANSQEFGPVQMVSTKPDSIENIVSSDLASTVRMVQTSASARPREIDDQQLLASFSGQPVALIHLGAHQAELMFPK